MFGFEEAWQGLRSWIRVDSSGNSQVIEVDKFTIMRRCDLPARDLRLLDPLFVYPSTILGREKAIYVVELQRRLQTAGVGEVWQSEGAELNRRRSRNFDNVFGNHPLIICPLSLGPLKLLWKLPVHSLILRRMESSFYGDQSLMGFRSNDGGLSASAPVSPVSSPPESRRLEKSLSIARSRHESMRSTESSTESIEQLEMLLEAYFVVIDSTLNKLTSLKEYIDDTEDFINIQLDNVRNQLIQFELLLTTATFVVAIFGVVAGIFGMNFDISLFEDPGAFKWVLIITGVAGISIFCAFVWFFKYRRLMPL
ncbi:hypothetical protein GH714_025789 [Hevea brasiliensis]|uniref:Magnesium transporter n=1 Tax=Hevea brasiliensis TaxID=3981 RepID=A0A6A6LMS8_HEVBR|nr:hypothetical protein GH714_025789 [Hevea brasiliensis]